MDRSKTCPHQSAGTLCKQISFCSWRKVLINKRSRKEHLCSLVHPFFDYNKKRIGLGSVSKKELHLFKKHTTHLLVCICPPASALQLIPLQYPSLVDLLCL
ncbi:hypothetical protein Q5P01_010126 [Channa striata]|uniref:Uncharacterized protein n=1 Tax=Channa striata TaxID=64152 RepID=A0AA88MY28_CHASR|nr:hypothetical protein Q5P01_010126 [Channa striata]